MIDYNKIIKISPENESIKFVVERLKSKNYRGFHLVQHQRVNYSELIGFLLCIYAVVNNNKMPIPKGDPSNISDLKEYPEFKKAFDLYVSTFGKATYKGVIKVVFLNLNRMGLLDRFNSSGVRIEPKVRSKKISSVGLSELGQKLLENPDKTKYLFLKGLDILFDGFINDLFELLQNEFINGYLEFDEFFLFVSYLGFTLDSKTETTTLSDVINLIMEFRKLKKHQKRALIDELSIISKLTKKLGKNNGKIDLKNWKNQTQSIFSFLSYAANLTVYDNKIFFGNKNKSSKITLERSSKQKELYFLNHYINRSEWKSKGFELHHIFPISYAENDKEFMEIDSWENLIYLDGMKHAQITQNRNAHLKISFDSDVISFSKPESPKDCIKAKKDENAIFNDLNQQLMLEKNIKLLESI